MEILKYEDKIADWIEHHRVIWGISLFLGGILLGLGSNYILGGKLEQGVTMAICYGFLLVTVEVCTGGSGYQK